MNKRVNFKKWPFFSAIFFFSIVYFYAISQSVYDDYQVLYYLLAGGFFSDVPVMGQHFLGHILYSEVINFFYSINNKISWLGLLEVGLLMLSGICYLLIMYVIARRIFNNTWFVFITLTIGSLMFLDAFSFITHTRSALVLCGIGCFGTLFLEKKKNSNILFLVLFFMGILLRPEAGIGMSMFIGIAYLIYRWDPFFVLNRMKWVLVIVIIMTVGIYLLINYGNSFLFQIEPEIEYKFLQGYYLRPEMFTSPQDSIKFLLATSGFIFDPQVLTPEYLRSIQVNPNANDIFKRSLQGISDVLNYWMFYCIPFGVFLFLFLFSILKGLYRFLIKLSILTVVITGLFLQLKLSSEISYRHVQPFLSMYTLIVLFYIYKLVSYKKFSNPLIWTIFLLAIMFSTDFYIKNLKSRYSFLLKKTIMAEARLENLENEYKNRLVVGTISSMGDVFNRRFSFINKNQFNNRYMMFDNYNFSMNPPYDAYLKRVLKNESYNANDAYNYFCDHQALYLTDEKRVQMTEDYLKLIYNNNIKFKKEAFEFEPKSDVIVSRLVRDN